MTGADVSRRMNLPELRVQLGGLGTEVFPDRIWTLQNNKDTRRVM